MISAIERQTELTKTATSAVLLKLRMQKRDIRRAAFEQLHVKKVEKAEADLQDALAPMFVEQIESAQKALAKLAKSKGDDYVWGGEASTLAKKVFDPSEWDEELVNRALPPLAKIMAEEMLRFLKELGVDPRRKRRRRRKTFCPTGPGGGVDPTCSPGQLGGSYKLNFSVMDSKLGDPEAVYESKAKELFGTSDKNAIAKITGAPSGSEVNVTTEPDRITVDWHKDGIKALRIVKKGYDDKTYIENAIFEIPDSMQGKGEGTRIFHEQVKAAEAHGIERIECFASKGGGKAKANGYYTWPRLGYDRKLPSSVREKLPSEFDKSEVTSLSDLMRTSAGRDWWKANGEALDLEFDTRSGSHSRWVLDAYVSAKFGEAGKSAGAGSGGRRATRQDLGRAGFGGVKASTATEWLDDWNIELEDVEFATPSGPVSMGFATEYPTWMKSEIRQRLNESFEQDYWERVNETTFGDIEGYLRTGIKDGWSIRRMADEIIPKLMNDGHYAEWRAKNIARTESGNALNGARVGSADKLIKLIPELPMKKVWLSVLGTTTRKTHADLDGVPADKNDRWKLSGISVRWPADIVLPPEERCQCQCTVIVEFGMSDESAEELLSDYGDRLTEEEEYQANEDKTFCPTGPGGGVDPTCSPGQSGGSRTASDFDITDGGKYKLYDDVQEADEYLEGLHQNLYDQITKDEQLSIDMYFGSTHSWRVNEGLRYRDADQHPTVKGLDSVLQKSSFPEDVVAFRSIRATDVDHRDEITAVFKANVGNTLVDKAFVSTTINKTYAKDWGKDRAVEVRVRVPKGAKAFYSDKTGAMEEWEILIDRNSSFRVLSASDDKVDLELML